MNAGDGRAYHQSSRADSVQRNREAILGATRELFFSRYFGDVALRHVADRSGVTVQTILRHFASKSGLLEAALESWDHEATAAHESDAVGDPQGALSSALARYESMGDGILMILSQESSVEPFARLAQLGRDKHRAWLERIFAPYLPAKSNPLRERRLLQLLAIFDVYTWKLLRRDHGNDLEAVHEALAEQLEFLLNHLENTQL